MKHSRVGLSIKIQTSLQADALQRCSRGRQEYDQRATADGISRPKLAIKIRATTFELMSKNTVCRKRGSALGMADKVMTKCRRTGGKARVSEHDVRRHCQLVRHSCRHREQDAEDDSTGKRASSHEDLRPKRYEL